MPRVAQKIGHHHRIIDACLLIGNMSFSRFSSTFLISILRIHLLEVLHCTKKKFETFQTISASKG